MKNKEINKLSKDELGNQLNKLKTTLDAHNTKTTEATKSHQH